MIRTTMSTSRTFSGTSTGAYKCKRLQGKVAIVTASTLGIGFAIAKRLAQEGAKVMISSRKEKNVNEAVEVLRAEKLEVSGTVCHVGKFEDRKKLFDQTKSEFNGLDILVSNAAVNPAFGSLFDCTEEQWDKIFNINVKSTFLLMKEALPLLRKSKSPSIIIISSIAGYQPFQLLGPYSVSKTALLGLCKAASTELASENIRVNCIAPGIIRTKFSSVLYESEPAHEEVMRRVPIGRIGEVDEVAGAAAYLASTDSSYVTGETITVTGGMTSRL